MIECPGIIDKIQGNKDGSFTIKIETPELTPEESTKLFELRNIEMWCGFDSVRITKLDIPEEVVEFKGDKSKSQKLKEVLWVVWNTKTDKSKVFEEWRQIQMDKIIQMYLDKLD